jgi:tetratricopeptide (TPR) repeat protein
MARTRSARHRSICWIVCLGILVTVLPPAWSQLGPLPEAGQAPQAKSQDEFDSYLEIVTETDPRKVIQRVDAMASHFPDSKLLGIAYQYQMHAYQQIGNADGMLAAGKKALTAFPDNLNTLLTLAPAMANFAVQGPDRAQLLSQAETYARAALDAIEKIHPPHQVSLEDWNQQKRSMQSSAHETLGVIDLDRGNASGAITEFETAIELRPVPEGALFFRLGVAYRAAGRKDDARSAWNHAAQLGPDVIRRLAANQLKGLAAK